ncbi:MAG: N-acetylneuraminate synthase [Chryseolinea sp.]
MVEQAKVIIIAEAGVNHNGDIGLAKKLIDTAAEAGADYVKFQTFKAEKLVSPSARKAEYQQVNDSDKDTSQFSMLKRLELDAGMHRELMEYAAQKRIGFLSTGFDPESLDLLYELGIELYKIPSGEITNLPLLEKIASFGKPVIISTGMATLQDIDDAIGALISGGINKTNITVLHCNTQYPTPMEDVNLRAMQTIANSFQVKVGYSDHTLGIEVPIASVALGACVVEKHFTLDRTLPGPDHAASLEPNELAQMVSAIRNIELALGTAFKEPSPSELPNMAVARKSVHLVFERKQGDLLIEDDLIMLRPGDGISPMNFRSTIGRRLLRDLPAGHKLNWSDLA